MRFNGLYDQLAAVLSQIQMGDRSSDHSQEAIAGYHGINYVAINAVLKQVGRSTAFVYDDASDLGRKEIRKSIRLSNPWNFHKAAMQDHVGELVDKKHPLLKLLNKPNPGQTGSHFRMECVLQMRLHGSALIWNRFNQPQTRVIQRYVIPWAFVEPVRPGVEKGAPRGGVKIRPVGASVVFANEIMSSSPVFGFSNCVIPVERLSIARYPSPYFRTDGHSLTSAISKWIDSATHVDNTRMDFYGIGPDGRIIIASESDDKDTMRTTEESINRKLSDLGMRCIVVSGKNQILQQRSAEDVGFDDAYNQLIDNIFMAHGISRAVVGDQDSMTYGSIAASLFSSSVLSIQPDLDLLADEDTLDLADQYDGELSIEYSVPPIEDPERQDSRLEADGKVGAITMKEWRTARGREPYGTALDDFIITSQGPVDPQTLIQPPQQPGMPGMGAPGMGAPGQFGQPAGGFGQGAGGFGGGGGASPFGQHDPQSWQFSNPNQISKNMAYSSIDLPVVGVDYGAVVSGRRVKPDARKSIDILHKSGCRVSIMTGRDPDEVKKSLVELGLDLPVNDVNPQVVLFDDGTTQNLIEGLRLIVDNLPSPQREQILATIGTKRSYGYISLPIEGTPGEAIRDLGRSIDPSHLADGGYVSDPHVTLLYGIVGEEPEDVVRKVRRLPSPTVTVGSMTTLSDSGKGVPVVVLVSGETIMSMRDKVVSEVPHMKGQFGYRPHITLGYVKPEFAKLYSGPTELSGWTIELGMAEVYGEDRSQIFSVPLRGMLSKEHMEDSAPVSLPGGQVDILKAVDVVDEIGDIMKAKIGAMQSPIAKENLIAAGLCVLAADTGRVLLLQRAMDPTDPASGCWEFPGGHIEDGERPIEAAKREWSEETGCIVPRGKEVANWKSGIYQGFVWLIDKESSVNINPGGKRKVLNPDDPDGDMVEVVAWYRPGQLVENGNLRSELKNALGPVIAAIRSAGDTNSRIKEKVTDWKSRLEALERRKVGKPDLPKSSLKPVKKSLASEDAEIIAAIKRTMADDENGEIIEAAVMGNKLYVNFGDWAESETVGKVQRIAASLGMQVEYEHECGPLERMYPGCKVIKSLGGRIARQVLESEVNSMFSQIAKQWREDEHPRGKDGRFIDAGRIAAAAKASSSGDSSKVDELMKEVKAEDVGKLKNDLAKAGDPNAQSAGRNSQQSEPDPNAKNPGYEQWLEASKRFEAVTGKKISDQDMTMGGFRDQTKWINEQIAEKMKGKLDWEGDSPAPANAEGSDKELAEIKERNRARFRESIATANLSPEKKREYMGHVQAALEQMPMGAQKIVEKNVKSISWYEDANSLSQSAAGILGIKLQQGEVVQGLYVSGSGDSPVDGVAHLDGGKDPVGTYVHELAHGFDWDGSDRISNSQEWQDAWSNEIAKGGLSAYGKTAAIEGFAEMARLVYRYGDEGVAMAHKKFPRCSEIFVRHGLMKGTESGSKS